MQPHVVWKNLGLMIFWSLAAGLLNLILFATIINPFNKTVKADEVAANTFTLNLFVVWALFTVWFLAKADEEWKKTAEAVNQGNRETFLVEAPKRIALSIRVLYIIISLWVIVSFYLFHIESALVMGVIEVGVGFVIALAIQFLWDLDDPISGAVNVSGIPQDWIAELKKKQ